MTYGLTSWPQLRQTTDNSGEGATALPLLHDGERRPQRLVALISIAAVLYLWLNVRALTASTRR